jgi:phosphate transport system substrate-binding protein
MKRHSFAAASAISFLLLGALARAVELDPLLPEYKTVGPLAGHIKSVGSDTMGALMNQWAEGFNGLYPNVTIAVDAKGSSTAPPALSEGASQLGPMSRSMQKKETEAFESKYGYAPVSMAVAVDALAIYVNKDNPIQCLTMQQVDQIFSGDHWNSGGIDIATWGEAGLTGDWANQPISLFGRNSVSGTYQTFKETVLYNGDFKHALHEQPGSEDVVRLVASDRNAIGYSGIGFLNSGVRAVPLAVSRGDKCYDTSAESAYAGKYPLARYLYVYFNKNPKQALDPTIEEFLKYVLSKDGQTVTMKAGFYPVTNAVRVSAFRRLGVLSDAN